MTRLIHRYLVAFAIAALGCSESFRPDVSTETGNPPVIDSRKIALVVTQAEVHVRGEAGAISPPEADVEVTIVRTQEVTRGEVEDDGSFDVIVEASIDDVFEVRAVLGGERSDVVIVDRGGAMVGEANGGRSLSCEQQSDVAGSILQHALANADRSCEVADDCILFNDYAACANDCSPTYVSEDGLRSIRAAIDNIDEAVCATFTEDGCELMRPLTCVSGLSGICSAGRCEGRESTGNECDGCVDLPIVWQTTGPGILPAAQVRGWHTLQDCNRLVRTADAGSCETAVPQCTDDAPASIEAINALIATDAVQAALTQGGIHGEPEETSGFVYAITVGQRQFTYRTCAGLPAYECLPPGPIEELIALLEQLQNEHACRIESDACTAPFDSGTCDGAFEVWWHDPLLGACRRQSWGGCEGNANRYDTEEACQAACPAPTGQGACAEGRVFAHLSCTACGPIGGCWMPADRCLAACTVDEDCEAERSRLGEPREMHCFEGTCRVRLGCL